MARLLSLAHLTVLDAWPLASIDAAVANVAAEAVTTHPPLPVAFLPTVACR